MLSGIEIDGNELLPIDFSDSTDINKINLLNALLSKLPPNSLLGENIFKLQDLSEFKSGKKIEITNENIITLINTFTEMPSSITPKEMYDILVSEKK